MHKSEYLLFPHNLLYILKVEQKTANLCFIFFIEGKINKPYELEDTVVNYEKVTVLGEKICIYNNYICFMHLSLSIYIYIF